MEIGIQTEPENQAIVKPQTKVKIRYCKRHPEKEINGFCEESEEFFCRKCMEDHLDHDTVSLKRFCGEKRRNILEQVSVRGFSAQMKEKNDEMIKIREKLDKELKDTNKDITLKEEVLKDGKEEAFKEEMVFIEAGSKYLLELEDKVSTVALKDACENAMELFNIEDKIREEFETMEKDLEDARIKVKELEKQLEEMDEDINVLDHLKEENEKYEFDDDKWTTFSLLNKKTPLFTPPGYRINTTVDKFQAFPFIGDVFDVDGIMKQKLVNLGEEIKISGLLKIDDELITGDDIFASLSHQGILAISVHSDNDYIIQFTDLCTNKQVEVKAEHESIIAFYDDMILLLTWEKPLRETRLENVFDSPTIEMFKEIEGTNDALHTQMFSYQLNERTLVFDCS